MSNPAAPMPPNEPPRPAQPGQPGIVSDPDVAPTGPAVGRGSVESLGPGDMPEGDDINPFGPDAPNVRPGDPKGGQTAPEAPPERSPSTMPEGDDFAPDEAGASG